MLKLKYLSPYKSDGKTTFPEIQKKTGCYIIKENNKIVYVGYSGKNLYKTMYRHFQSWNHRSQEVITYTDKLKQNKYTVRIILCTAKQAEALEKKLILKHQPRDNSNKYESFKSTRYADKVLEQYIKEIEEKEVPF